MSDIFYPYHIYLLYTDINFTYIYKMDSKSNTKLTSVKIIDRNYHEFKKITLGTDLTLQKFVNRAIDLYLKETEFKNKIESHQTNGAKNSKY